MENKDKRSLLLSLILGDGCLHYIKSHGVVYGGITIAHCLAQTDLLEWKAKLISDIAGRPVRLRKTSQSGTTQISICMKRLRAWRKFTYLNNKKSLPRILKFIRHPEFAMAVWLMDDGYVEHGIYKGKTSGAGLRIFTCDQTDEDQILIIKWIKDNFGADSKIRFSKHKGRGKKYPFIKINQEGSLLIWEKIRDFVLQFDSMKYKFRHIENIYQHKLLQRVPVENSTDDIVST